MANYLFYTGIILTIWGLIGGIFTFFYFDIKENFSEWQVIKKSEFGKKVITPGRVQLEDSEQNDEKIDNLPNNFGESIIESRFTEVLIENEEPQEKHIEPEVLFDIEEKENKFSKSFNNKGSEIELLFPEVIEDDDDSTEILKDEKIESETELLFSEVIENEEGSTEVLKDEKIESETELL